LTFRFLERAGTIVVIARRAAGETAPCVKEEDDDLRSQSATATGTAQRRFGRTTPFLLPPSRARDARGSSLRWPLVALREPNREQRVDERVVAASELFGAAVLDQASQGVLGA
jgi:hypothetical protein